MYRCRKVQCPYCNHIFMRIGRTNPCNKIYEYYLKGDTHLLDDATCPKCGKLLLIHENIFIGLTENDPRISIKGIRGI